MTEKTLTPLTRSILAMSLKEQVEHYIASKTLNDTPPQSLDGKKSKKTASEADKFTKKIATACSIEGFTLNADGVKAVEAEVKELARRGYITKRQGSAYVNAVKGLYEHVAVVALNEKDAKTLAAKTEPPKTEPPKSGEEPKRPKGDDDPKRGDGIAAKKATETAKK